MEGVDEIVREGVEGGGEAHVRWWSRDMAGRHSPRGANTSKNVEPTSRSSELTPTWPPAVPLYGLNMLVELSRPVRLLRDRGAGPIPQEF
jgi:hypothetical protein